MSLIIGIILCLVFVFLLIFGMYKALTYNNKLAIGDDERGRNHCGLITFSASGGDIHFNDMNDQELYDKLKFDYNVIKHFNKPCANYVDESHLAEYRYITKNGKVKTIGWITKDKVVFEGKEYIFREEEPQNTEVHVSELDTSKIEADLDDAIPLEITGYTTVYNQAYVDKLEKTIKELTAECDNLKGIKLAQETALNTEYNIREQLQKENAELKDWKDKTVKARTGDYMIWSKTDDLLNKKCDQLNQAKQFIRDIIAVAIDYIDKEDKNYSYIIEAQQFLEDN